MKKRLIIISMIILTIIGGITIYWIFNRKIPKQKEAQQTVVISKISDYGYELIDSKNDLYKELFKELENILSGKEIDYLEYAKLIAQLFIVDFYSLDDKLTSSDIGGVMYIHLLEKDDFIVKATDTFYKHVENNIYGERIQELPIVSSINVNNTEQVNYEYNDFIDNNAFKIDLNWEYIKENGYQNRATIIVVHEDNKKLSIVEMN